VAERQRDRTTADVTAQVRKELVDLVLSWTMAAGAPVSVVRQSLDSFLDEYRFHILAEAMDIVRAHTDTVKSDTEIGAAWRALVHLKYRGTGYTDHTPIIGSDDHG
jgi:hypothetical protein